MLTGIIPEQNPVLTILTLWFDDYTGIAIFTPLFFIIFDRSNKIWRQRIGFLSLPVCALFALTSGGYLLAQHHEDERLRKIISEKGHSIRDGLQDEFQRHLSELRLCQELTATHKISTETDFRLFALLTFNQHADTSNYQWLEAHKNKGR